MARISFPDRGFGEHVDWALMRPAMAKGMGALSEAVYGNTQLSVREREAARWQIALINDCAVCRDTRARAGASAGADEPFYSEVTDWRSSKALSDREKLAAEFAERFALDHLAWTTSSGQRLRVAVRRRRACRPDDVLWRVPRDGARAGRHRCAGTRGAPARLAGLQRDGRLPGVTSSRSRDDFRPRSRIFAWFGRRRGQGPSAELTATPMGSSVSGSIAGSRTLYIACERTVSSWDCRR